MREFTIQAIDESFEKTFKFTSAQQRFTDALFKKGKIDTKYKEFSFYGGVRCGKSFITQFCVWYICTVYPNVNVLYVRDTYSQLTDSVIKQFNDDFGFAGTFLYRKSERTAYFDNGSVVKFRAFDVDGRGILSTEYDAVCFCQAEDIQEDLFLMALSRLSGPNLPTPLLFVEGNPASTWPKKRYKDVPRETLEEKGIYFCEVTTEENSENLPKGYIDSLLANYPQQWINRYLLSEWTQIDEMVFNEFKEHEHVIDPFELPKTYERIIGMDYGFKNPSGMVWLAIDYDGVCYIFDEYYEREKLIPELAEANKKHGSLITIIDYAVKSPGKDGRSIWTEFISQGLRLIESNKSKQANITLVNNLFKQKKLFIFRNCHNLVHEIKNYKWKRLKLGDEKNMPEEVVKKDDHLNDALMYALAFQFGTKSKDPNRFPIEKTIAHLTESIDYTKALQRLG